MSRQLWGNRGKRNWKESNQHRPRLSRAFLRAELLRKVLITVVKEGQRRLVFMFACNVSPLTALVSPPPLLASLSAFAPSPHRRRWRIAVVGDSGRLPIVRQFEAEGIEGGPWSARCGGTLTWSPQPDSTRSARANGRAACGCVPSQRSRLTTGVFRFHNTLTWESRVVKDHSLRPRPGAIGSKTQATGAPMGDFWKWAVPQ